MKNLATFILMLIILVINNIVLFADSPVLKEAVRITEMKIIGEPLKDEKIILSVEYISFVNIDASIKLIFSNYIKPPNYFGEGNFIKEIQRLNENQLYRKEFELDVKDIGNSIITFAIRTEELIGYNNAVSRYLSFEINESDYLIYDERSETIERQPLTINPKRGIKSRGTEALYTVSVSGNVNFYDSHQYTNKGLYGNTVELWFRNSNNPNNWYHPVYSPNCTGSQYVHYDIVDANGNYNFNFNFNGNLSNYNQVLIIISRDNSSAYMLVQQNGITTWCDNTYQQWFSLSESFIGNIDGSNTNIILNNANCMVNSPDGEIFRNMMFASEFVIQRYNGSLPFSLPKIYVLRASLLPDAAGRFISSGSGVIPRIEIDHNYPELTTTSHEFGHFVNYKMWNNYLIGNDGCSDALGQTTPGTGRIYKEGWAIHYSFCTRNYANKVFGEDLRSWDDNTETAAYETPRFNNIRYTSVDPNISAYACYLWNLYDDYNNGNFETSTLLGDNDDISGRSVRVFETMRTPIMDCSSKFNTKFKTGLTTEEQTSIEDNYTFMFSNSNHKPRSAQISSVTAQVISSNQIRFQWLSQSYPTNYYRNYESGYYIYKNVNNIWQLIYTASAGTTNYTYQTNETYGDFRLSSYNSTGVSYNAYSLNVPLVAPVISNITQNPVPIYKGTYGYVYCNLAQGNGNLTYNWFSYDQPSYVSIVPEGYRCKIIYHATETTTPIEAPGWSFGCTVTNEDVSGWSDSEPFQPSLNPLLYGCPTLAFDNRGTLTSENPLLITSISNPGKDVTDYYLINTPLTANNNKINVTIHEPQTEHTWIDNVSLLEARSNPDEKIVVNDEGQVISYKGVLPARILLNGETDITQNLLELDSLSVELNPGDKLTISRNATEGDGDIVVNGEEGIPISKRIPAMLMNVITQKQDLENDKGIITEIIPFTNFFLRPNKSTISKKLRNIPTGTIEITVNKKLTLDYFVFVSDLRTARTRTLPLVSAVHNVNGDIKSKLSGIDQNYAEMYPTERIDLSFSTTTNNGNRAYILKTVGRYETDTTFIAKQNKLAKQNELPIVPTENKLYDNYPNPFNPSTIIKYSLKDDGKVLLKIFNSLGEEVRTLVNEIKPAGNYEVEFNASNLPSGVYIYSIQSGEFVSSKKMILIK